MLFECNNYRASDACSTCALVAWKWWHAWIEEEFESVSIIELASFFFHEIFKCSIYILRMLFLIDLLLKYEKKHILVYSVNYVFS